MVGRSFVCRECGTSVSVLSYRATCPDCSGKLEQTTHAEP
ncbi:rubrerythrin-like domain-containing protein [Halobaculum halobium]